MAEQTRRLEKGLIVHSDRDSQYGGNGFRKLLSLIFMNKIVYIIGQGHTGSTLLDCIMGTHPEVISSGEMCYLNYQIERSANGVPTIAKQDICTCLHSFLECDFWKSVASNLFEKTSLNILESPQSFDRAFFGVYSYKGRGGHPILKKDRKKRKKIQKMLLKDYPWTELLGIEPKIDIWVKNEWSLCESMSEAGNKGVVVDSSKDITKALLMQQYYPDKVMLIFIHRDIRGLTASFKRRVKKRKGLYLLVLPYVMLKMYRYESMVSSVRKIRGLSWMDVHYEEFVRYPQEFLTEFSRNVKLNKKYVFQANDEFYIEPNKLHIVAGNPIRYKGRQKVKYDERWNSELNRWELAVLNLFRKFFI